MTPRRVEVRIDELVLHGFPPLDARAVGEVVELELAALLGARPPVALRGAERVDGGSFDAPAELDARALGAAVAGRVREALGAAARDAAVTPVRHNRRHQLT